MISNGPETTLLRQEDYQTPSSPKAFDPLLLDQPIRLNGKPKRVFYKTAKGKVRSFGLNESNQIHDVLLLAFGYGIYSSDITNLEKRTQEQYSSSVGQFFDWINEYKYHSCSKNKYRCLKDYESFKMNQRGVKTSPIGILKVVLKSGLDAPLISPQDRKYIEQLLTLSIPVKTNKKESSTLSDWFSISWLQHHLGSTNYLKLESPSRIFSSFRVTIGSTLLYLLDIRDNWHLHPDIEFESNYKNWCYDWNRLLIGKIGQFDNNGEATDELTKVLLQDLIKPSCHENVKNQIKHDGKKSLSKKYTINKKRVYSCQKPVFFQPNFQNQYSPLEELLMSWLAACETVQPSDIKHLKTTDYAFEFNTSGRLIMMECKYYKGRSGSNKTLNILNAKDIWTRAQYKYITNLSKGDLLVKSDTGSQINMPGLGKFADNHNIINYLFKLWSLPELNRLIRRESEKAQTQTLFLDVILKLQLGSESRAQYYHRTKKPTSEYQQSVPRPLPSNWFSLTHIKNTAVHAGSDKYRDSDLINNHSHTSETEKFDYLTDDNKDYVNRLHRITRLVIHDLQNVVYQPTLGDTLLKIHDVTTRTRVSNVTGEERPRIQLLKALAEKQNDDDELIVMDTVDTALYAIHYLKQAEAALPKLLIIRPDFVEKTLILNVEWMSTLLTKLSHTKAAKQQYKALKEHLPPMFDYLLESAE